MNTVPGVTDDDLTRARSDPAFRQKLLTESLETLLAQIQKLRKSAQSAPSDAQLREGVELAVRLAELIQKVDGQPSGSENRPKAAGAQARS
jgi:phage shock protein A